MTSREECAGHAVLLLPLMARLSRHEKLNVFGLLVTNVWACCDRSSRTAESFLSRLALSKCHRELKFVRLMLLMFLTLLFCFCLFGVSSELFVLCLFQHAVCCPVELAVLPP